MPDQVSSPTGDCHAEHFGNLAARHPHVKGLVVRCNRNERADGMTVEAVCQLLTVLSEGLLPPISLCT